MGVGRDSLLLHFSRNGDFGPDRSDLLVLERGEGPYVFDSDERRYFDGLSSLFCCQLGYSYGTDFGAIASEQMERLCFNTNWGTAHPPALELAQRLSDLSPTGPARVFFTCGGSESVESAWKIIRQYHVARGEPERVKAISRDIAYHGVTLGALALTGVESFKRPFGPPAIPTISVANTNSFRSELSPEALTSELLAELEEAIVAAGPGTVAAIFAEPVQNAGGCLVPTPGYWVGLRELADRYGIVLVADEVITGMGRLGDWFGSTTVEARPDIVTAAKGLTSGYAPMGAVLVSERVAAPLYEAGALLLHGVTFGGHPVSAAVALRNLELFESERILDNVRSLEGYLRSQLETLYELPIVGDVRGAGFFWAMEMVKEDGTPYEGAERERLLNAVLPRRLRAAGLIARADGRGDAVLQVAPPLVSDRAHIDELVGKVGDVLSDAAAEAAAKPSASLPQG